MPQATLPNQAFLAPPCPKYLLTPSLHPPSSPLSVENEIFESIANVMSIDADDLDIPLSIADALDAGTKPLLAEYLREQVLDACGDER